MTELIFALMLALGGAILIIGAPALAISGSIPRPSRRVSSWWAAVAGVANVALAFAWLVERGLGWAPILFLLFGVWNLVVFLRRLPRRSPDRQS